VHVIELLWLVRSVSTSPAVAHVTVGLPATISFPASQRRVQLSPCASQPDAWHPPMLPFVGPVIPEQHPGQSQKPSVKTAIFSSAIEVGFVTIVPCSPTEGSPHGNHGGWFMWWNM
jgi:hypothetical protein